MYGVELYGGSNPLAVVPSAVSTASAVQKLVSAVMIFLFGLALRNMLKGKPAKVAITAVMRKLIVTLNAMLRTGEPWRHSQTA